jgi:outer membrane protein assembly factor BamD (BamD/ComL family)
MSVAGISSSNLFNINDSRRSVESEMKQEFAQLGQDLQSGNLSAAQTDFATLTQMGPQSTSSSSSSTAASNSPMAQAFAQLSKDLQSGNLSAAQQDFATIQQDMQSNAVQSGGHRHHHHGGENAISSLFSQLGQALQSGDLSTAQQVFSTMQQDFQQAGQSTSGTTEVQPNAVSVNA